MRHRSFYPPRPEVVEGGRQLLCPLLPLRGPQAGSRGLGGGRGFRGFRGRLP